MLATDYPWNYLLEDIPVSQPFTTTEELSKDKRLEMYVVFVYKEAARRRKIHTLNHKKKSILSIYAHYLLSGSGSPALPLFQYEDFKYL